MLIKQAVDFNEPNFLKLNAINLVGKEPGAQIDNEHSDPAFPYNMNDSLIPGR
jgi:hypothetical protein